jgi:hypothetical protein
VNGAVQLDRRGRLQNVFLPPISRHRSTSPSLRVRGTGSENRVFDVIRELHPLFYMNVGDFHYLNIKTNSVTIFRMAYDQVLLSPQQSLLYRFVPFTYIWDDHDFAGQQQRGHGEVEVGRAPDL